MILGVLEIDYPTVIHLLYPMIYIQQSQNNKTNAVITNMITESSLGFFAVRFGSGIPLEGRVYSYNLLAVL